MQADVKTSILGADSLAHFTLSRNMAIETLIDNETQLKIRGTLRYFSTGIRSGLPNDKTFREILHKFPGITTPFKHTDPVLHITKLNITFKRQGNRLILPCGDSTR